MSQINLYEAMSRYFEPGSLCRSGSPKAVILMGGLATGKTTIRRRQYSHGHVLIDAAQIFLDLCHGEVTTFPGAFKDDLEQIGRLVSRRATKERRHLVTEIIGDDFANTVRLIDALKKDGYLVDIVPVKCEAEASIERARDRLERAVSARYAGPMNTAWILDALA